MDINLHTKNNFIPELHTWDIADLSFWVTSGMFNYVTPHYPDIYQSISMDIYPYTKSSLYALTHSRDVGLSKNHFGYNSRTKILPDMRFQWKAENYKNLHFKLFSGKSDDKMFVKLKIT